MMTEEEAKKKWCPHVRLGDSASNRWSTEVNLGGIAPAQSCIGSACMAWRFNKPVTEYHGPFAEAEAYPPPGDGWTLFTRMDTDVRSQIPSKKIHWERTVANASGYCGLAGKDEK